VNNPEPYEHRTDRTAPEPTPAAAPETAALAVHRDPSLAIPNGSASSAELAHGSIVWVRPTDLITTQGALRLRRVVDAQADAVRRTRRVPLTAASRLRSRISRSAIAAAEPAVRTSATGSEGVQL
jgi:hypothetical protein